MTDVGQIERNTQDRVVKLFTERLSFKSRLDKVVQDIFKDFRVKTRLKSGQGNAMLVASSVAQACKYYELFQATDLKDHCAVVTSFVPNINDIKGEETGEGKTEEQLKYDTYIHMLDGKTTEEFEEEAKRKFINEPARMKLLIVVDKLLTGFDAPPASYLYIDNRYKTTGCFRRSAGSTAWMMRVRNMGISSTIKICSEALKNPSVPIPAVHWRDMTAKWCIELNIEN